MKIYLLGINSITVSVAQKMISDGNLLSLVGASSQKDLSKVPLNLHGYYMEDIDGKLSDIPQDNSLVISVGAPWFLTKEVIERFPGRIFNLHGSRLPKDRGGNLFSWLILNGQRVGICAIHDLLPEIDAGDIFDWEEYIYPAHCRIPRDFQDYYNQKNIVFLENFILEFINKTKIFNKVGQPAYLSTYWPRLLANIHGWIDWGWNTIEIERFICAFDDPYPGARCRLNGEIVILKEVYSQATDGYTHPFQNGLIYRNNGKWLSVAVSGGELLACSVTDKSGNNLISNIKVGDRFYTTAEDLLQTRQRAIRSNQGLFTKPLTR